MKIPNYVIRLKCKILKNILNVVVMESVPTNVDLKKTMVVLLNI